MTGFSFCILQRDPSPLCKHRGFKLFMEATPFDTHFPNNLKASLWPNLPRFESNTCSGHACIRMTHLGWVFTWVEYVVAVCLAFILNRFVF